MSLSRLFDTNPGFRDDVEFGAPHPSDTVRVIDLLKPGPTLHSAGTLSPMRLQRLLSHADQLRSRGLQVNVPAEHLQVTALAAIVD